MVCFIRYGRMTPTRVLIVDDVAQVRSNLRTALTLSGDIEIIGEASNGVEAIRLAQLLSIDVILMDLEMPRLDGYETARRIKACYPECRVVALTVHDYAAAREKARQSGVDAFLVKGAPVKTIVQTILKKE